MRRDPSSTCRLGRWRRQPCDAPRVVRASKSWRGQNDATRFLRCHTEHGARADRIGAAGRWRPPGRGCTREGSACSAGEVPGRAVARGCRQGLSRRTRSRIRLTAAPRVEAGTRYPSEVGRRRFASAGLGLEKCGVEPDDAEKLRRTARRSHRGGAGGRLASMLRWRGRVPSRVTHPPVSAGQAGTSAGGVSWRFVGIELREATGDESRVQRAVAEAVVSRETNLTGAHSPRICGRARTSISAARSRL